MRLYLSLFVLTLHFCLLTGKIMINRDDNHQKRAVRTDLISHVSCRLMKLNGYCKYSFIKNKLCYTTCGCDDVLSQKSCKIIKTKSKCQASLYAYCQFTCDQCMSCVTSIPLGMKSRAIPDSRITASSMYTNSHRAARGRLDIKPISGGVGAWCAKNNNVNEWLQVDLGNITKITNIATQGRQDKAEWLKSYHLQYSLDGTRFADYEGGKIFKGNSDKNTIVKHALKPVIIARYIRVRPKTWHSWICMRMELYGCK